MQNIVTAAFPFVPAEINLAHIASTYLPADIYYRFLKLQGKKAIYISATDVHGAWIKKEMKTTNESKELITKNWHEKYINTFKTLGISFDIYSRTDSENLSELVQSSLNNLKEKDFIYKNLSVAHYCKQCFENLPRRFRSNSNKTSLTGKTKIDYKESSEDQKCCYCKSTEIETRTSNHWFLNLNKGISAIEKIINQQSSISFSFDFDFIKLLHLIEIFIKISYLILLQIKISGKKNLPIHHI